MKKAKPNSIKNQKITSNLWRHIHINRDLKRYLILSMIKEIQIKTTKYHLHVSL